MASRGSGGGGSESGGRGSDGLGDGNVDSSDGDEAQLSGPVTDTSLRQARVVAAVALEDGESKGESKGERAATEGGKARSGKASKGKAAEPELEIDRFSTDQLIDT
jgi:hypothetical protein